MKILYAHLPTDVIGVISLFILIIIFPCCWSSCAWSVCLSGCCPCIISSMYIYLIYIYLYECICFRLLCYTVFTFFNQYYFCIINFFFLCRFVVQIIRGKSQHILTTTTTAMYNKNVWSHTWIFTYTFSCTRDYILYRFWLVDNNYFFGVHRDGSKKKMKFSFICRTRTH